MKHFALSYLGIKTVLSHRRQFNNAKLQFSQYLRHFFMIIGDLSNTSNKVLTLLILHRQADEESYCRRVSSSLATRRFKPFFTLRSTQDTRSRLGNSVVHLAFHRNVFGPIPAMDQAYSVASSSILCMLLMCPTFYIHI